MKALREMHTTELESAKFVGTPLEESRTEKKTRKPRDSDFSETEDSCSVSNQAKQNLENYSVFVTPTKYQDYFLSPFVLGVIGGNCA